MATALRDRQGLGGSVEGRKPTVDQNPQSLLDDGVLLCRGGTESLRCVDALTELLDTLLELVATGHTAVLVQNTDDEGHCLLDLRVTVMKRAVGHAFFSP